jgi:Ni,Fe-hydrogenase III large subunit/Ni,Fe-hydrogenase III component G
MSVHAAEAIAIEGAAAARLLRVDALQWLEQARLRSEAGQRLLALWGSDERDGEGGFAVWAAYLDTATLDVLRLPVAVEAALFPDLSELFPAADRLQRSVHDLFGLRAMGGDTRPWLRHSAWSAKAFPLRRDFRGEHAPGPVVPYAFVPVAGDGVHEIPVGPVHAGIIEPGQFRFSVVGEKVLRLEQRLGFTHKGIEKRFEQLPALEAHALAARISGDSSVAYAWAYCMALEGVLGIEPPPRALYWRALLLERERIANHLGDLGALGNDAGFAFGLAQFSRLKEDLLRANATAFGHRYGFDTLLPGGVAFDLDQAARAALRAQGRELAQAVQGLRDIYADHTGVQDRFVDCGQVAPALAARLGLLGLAARASGHGLDLRCDRPHPPYDGMTVERAVRVEGDVAARVALRFDEVLVSLRLCERLLAEAPEGPLRAAAGEVPPDRLGVGLVEGWRGPVFLVLQTGHDGSLRRCHPHDPSWQNWPVLEHAVMDNIVPDFPLINKSFNLSYSGQDL